MSGLWIIVIIFIALALALIVIYNSLVKLRQFVDAGWSDIDVQLKRRTDLIPVMITTVKAYAKHEKTLFTDIAHRRSQAMAAGADPKARGAAEGALTRGTSRLMAVAEDYPELKASQNFLDLQNELSDTEDKIEMSRRYYNGTVRNMNTKVQSFPVNLIAGIFGFGSRDYFEIDAPERAVPDADI